VFLRVNNLLINPNFIDHLDLSELEDLRIVVTLKNGKVEVVTDIPAIELVVALRPSALESRRLLWARHAWAFHNLVGHPVMQLLAFFRKYKLAMWVHDATVPRPLGRK
jgi:hypothetical protein